MDACIVADSRVHEKYREADSLEPKKNCWYTFTVDIIHGRPLLSVAHSETDKLIIELTMCPILTKGKSMIKRVAEKIFRELARGFSAVSVIGPRQSGKTPRVREVFPDKPYVPLENP
jgi:hypothetical protein